MKLSRGTLIAPIITASQLSKVGEARIAADLGSAAVVVSFNGGPYVPIAGPGTAPGAPDTSVQFNSGGSFAGSANLTFNGTNLVASAAIFADGGIDRSAVAAMSIGAVNTTTLTLGRAGQVVNVTSRLNANGGGMDRATAGALNIGVATATSINLGRPTSPTNVDGQLTVDGGVLVATAGPNAYAQFAAGELAAVSPVNTARIRYNDAAGELQASISGGAYAPIGGAPGGADTELQFNDAGAFNGASSLTYDGVNLTASTQFNADGGIGRSSAGTLSIGTDANTTAITVGGVTNPLTYDQVLPLATNDAFLLRSTAFRFIEVDTTGPPNDLNLGQLTPNAPRIHLYCNDQNSGAFSIQYGAGGNNILAAATNAGLSMTFGNTLHNPRFNFEGNGGIWINGGNSYLSINDFAGTPTLTAGFGKYYTTDVGAITEAAYLDDTGNAVQMTRGGGLNGENLQVPDNTASAGGFFQGADPYIEIDTTNGAELVEIGLNANDPGVAIATETGAIGFFGATPAAQTAAYTVTNPVNTRAYDTTTVTTQTLAEVVSQIIADLQLYGLLAV